MKIEGVYNVSNNNSDLFYEQLINIINKLQKEGQEVEIQYSTNVNENITGGIVYSALVIGRK